MQTMASFRLMVAAIVKFRISPARSGDILGNIKRLNAGRNRRIPRLRHRPGTLLLCKQPRLSATFNDCGAHTLTFLPILFASFKGYERRLADSKAGFNRVRRYNGDVSALGRTKC